jgi:hypothetical protein
MELSGNSFSEVMGQSKNYDTINIDDFYKPKLKKISYELPCDCIDLEDGEQLNFYKNNYIVRKTLDVLNNRKLLNAVNRPNKYYLSLNDFVHQNRLIIPFYDENNKIIFYQSRKILDEDSKPKYLSKKDSDRSLFNINKISADIPYIFITEGPLDSTFIKNGIAVAGISESGSDVFTEKQKNQIILFPLHELIFVLDNQWNDSTSKNKSKDLLDAGKKVFIWPKEYSNFKDLNELCVAYNLNEFPYKFICKNSYKGLTGKIKLSEIN